jgi:signal recognition particle subunit SRP54
MDQLRQIEKRLKPHVVFFVCDAMTGQDAVNSADAFNNALDLNGVILTKLDGDARGGAALSIRHVTGVPIKFVGKGEKLDKLEAFDPARVVSQMLGMGDIVSLVEEAQRHISEEEALRQQERMAKGKFDLNDFRNQIIQMKKMGPVKDLLGKIPGMNQMAGQLDGMDADREVRRIQGIIDSMTPSERSNPALLDISRRRRVAAGAGVEPADVSSLIKQFEGMAAFIKQMSQMSMMDRIRMITGMGKGGMMNPAAMLGGMKGSTGKRLSPKEKEKLRKDREKAERKKRRDMKENRGGTSAP